MQIDTSVSGAVARTRNGNSILSVSTEARSVCERDRSKGGGPYGDNQKYFFRDLYGRIESASGL